jgi:hypothetical protein
MGSHQAKDTAYRLHNTGTTADIGSAIIPDTGHTRQRVFKKGCEPAHALPAPGFFQRAVL